ncbi:MAG: DNA polymerase III subunit alpha, partial [Candidatus Gastranaerophilales bacterium]|nr:DNA polymerase III subunit alpha [Candidatus Gastranaerophilales bacterium]
MNYVPLHLHTEYSLLDGAIKLPDLFKFAKENSMPAVAITDHGVMYGIIDMVLTHKEYPEVKPILGCEFYIAEGDVINDKSTKKTLYHLVLLAKNNTGYQNMIKMASIAAVQGYYYKPRINHEILEKYHEGIICLSACIQGEVARNILDGFEEKAFEKAKYYKNLFGEDFYIELQDHGLWEQKQSNPKLIEFAEKIGAKMVITNDSHYLRSQDALWHDTLLCEQTKSSKTDTNRFKFPNNEFYVKTKDELRRAFNWMDDAAFEECMNNTVEVANKCDVHIELGKSHLPTYPVPEGYDTNSYFDYLCREGLKRRYGENYPKDIEDRYLYEKSVIDKMGFPAYFLLTWDFINWAKKQNIPVGPGRGSAAGSIVAYALGITELDPIRHHLLFERFLNPERISMPDIDIDFCKRRRGEVIDYVTEKYGEDHVCQIITFGTLAAKAALKAVARVYDIDFTTSNSWAGLIPSSPGIKLSDALVEGSEFKKLYDSNPEVKKLTDEALHLEGIKNQVGTHAAGVIISHKPLDEIIPIALSKEKSVTTQFPMVCIEKLGLLKMDFLGLETLTVIRDCLDMIKKRKGIDFDINKIPLDDEKTFELLKRGETDGVFQLESTGMKRLVKELKPTVFEDLGALVALFRPGPLESGMVKDFVDRKHGRQKIEYAHPLLEDILKDTYGTIVYQEQIMKIFQVLAGYTLGGADMVRRMMGKKKLEEMAKQKTIFIEGAAKNGMSAQDAGALFEQIESFAKYCFNRSHSAAYAFVAYQTAYLKAHYPVEWMAAILTSQSNNQEKTQQYILQCQALGIKVLPPDINRSDADFTPDGDNIRFGLASIKNVGRGVVETIMQLRQEKEFESLYDYCDRMEGRGINKLTVEALIKVGAFSRVEKSRKQLVENLERITKEVSEKKLQRKTGQVSLFASSGIDAQDLGLPSFELLGSSDDEYKDTEIQQFEHELMGIYVSSHPLSSIKDTLKYLTTDTLSEIVQSPENDKTVTICGLLSQVVSKTKRGDASKILKIGIVEDLSGARVEFVSFPKVTEKYGNILANDEKVIMTARISKRDEEINLAVSEVRPIQNVSLFTIKMLKHFEFEENEYLKELLSKNAGDSPVVIDFEDPEAQTPDKRVQILTNKKLWINPESNVENR